METGIILLIISLAISLTYFIKIFNKIKNIKNNVNQFWSDIYVALEKKAETLEKIFELNNSFREHEKGLFKEIVELRQQMKNSNQAEEIEKKLSKVTSQIMVQMEAYPELKSSDVYIRTMDEVDEENESVAASIRLYNNSVNSLNSLIESFPANMLNAVFIKQKKGKHYVNSEHDNKFAVSARSAFD